MLKNWKIWLVVLVAFAIGQSNPLGRAFLKAAEWKLPEIKAESLAKPSPFESIAPEKVVGESENVFAFPDHKPIAPVHILIVPKKRILTINDASPELIAEMTALAQKLAIENGIAESGFRLVINTNPQGGQTVYHLHMHLIGGRQMGWLG